MLRGHGWMRLSALRSLFIAGSESIFSCVVVGRARARSVATTVPVASLRASAKQYRWACARIWIASSLSLLSTTRTPNFTSPRRGEVAGAAAAARAERGSELKTDSAPVARPPNRCGKTRAQTGRGNNYARRRLLQCTAGGVYCSARTKKLIRAAVKQMSSFSILYSVGTVYGMGTATNPKRASPAFIRLYANSRFAYAAFSTGSERTSYYLLHCGWG